MPLCLPDAVWCVPLSAPIASGSILQLVPEEHTQVSELGACWAHDGLGHTGGTASCGNRRDLDGSSCRNVGMDTPPDLLLNGVPANDPHKANNSKRSLTF